jgi:hypothetical protein
MITAAFCIFKRQAFENYSTALKNNSLVQEKSILDFQGKGKAQRNKSDNFEERRDSAPDTLQAFHRWPESSRSQGHS